MTFLQIFCSSFHYETFICLVILRIKLLIWRFRADNRNQFEDLQCKFMPLVADWFYFLLPVILMFQFIIKYELKYKLNAVKLINLGENHVIFCPGVKTQMISM